MQCLLIEHAVICGLECEKRNAQQITIQRYIFCKRQIKNPAHISCHIGQLLFSYVISIDFYVMTIATEIHTSLHKSVDILSVIIYL
jgi:hypothetical protein